MNAARSLSMRSSITEKHDAAVAIGDSKTEKLYEDGSNLDGPKRKRFFCWLLTKKQWLAAVIGSALVIILVILLIIFLAIVPAIFQNQVDKVHLTLNHLDIKSITTEGSTNKMNIELSVRLDAAGVSASSTIDEARVKLYFQDKAFMTVPLPEQHLKSGDNSFDIVVSDQVEVTDAETFRALSKRVITEKETLVDARTRLKVHAKGLSYGDLKLERTLTVKGIQQFNDPKPVFNNINLAECSDKAYKLIINITLDNEAGVGIGGIGALNLSVYNPVGYLGQAITHDTKGIPRGPKETMLDLTVAKDPKILPAFASLVSGFLAMNAPLFANGDHPYAMSAPLLSDAFAVLNVSLSYVDGLKKLTINPDCDVGAIVAAATSASNTTKA